MRARTPERSEGTYFSLTSRPFHLPLICMFSLPTKAFADAAESPRWGEWETGVGTARMLTHLEPDKQMMMSKGKEGEN